MSRRSCAISSIDIYSRIADRGGQVAPPAANPSQATGRVKRHDNQLHRARVLEVRIQSPPPVSLANFRSRQKAPLVRQSLVQIGENRYSYGVAVRKSRTRPATAAGSST